MQRKAGTKGTPKLFKATVRSYDQIYSPKMTPLQNV